MKNASVSVRIDENIKIQAEEILKKLGIPVSVLIDCLYRQIIETKEIPFPIAASSEPKTLDGVKKIYIDVGGTHGEFLVKCPRVLSVEELHDALTPFLLEHVDTVVKKIANSYGVTYEQLKDFAEGKDVDISPVVFNQIYWTILSKIDMPWWNIPEKILLRWELEDFHKRIQDEKE